MYASSIRMAVAGDFCLIWRTACSTSDCLWMVDDGLFGLQRNTRPAPDEADTSLSRSRNRLASSAIGLTGYLFRCAVCAGEPYDGSAVTSGFSVWQNAMTPAINSAPDPVAIITLSGLAPHMVAIACWKSATWTGG